MASADLESECSDTMSEQGSDHQDASAEIMSLDELTTELITVNRRFEALAFHFEYHKAEQKHIVALKDQKIEKLERELERKAQTTPETNNDIAILTSRIFQLKKTLKTLENEKATMFSAAKRKDEEIKNMRDRLEQVHKELHETQERLNKKNLEVRSHKEDKDRLERQLDENSRLMTENVQQMKVMQEHLKRDQNSAKRDMRQMEDRLVRKIDEVRENRDTSPPKAGKTIQEMKLDSGNVLGPGNRGTSTNRQRANVKFPPLSDRTTPDKRSFKLIKQKQLKYIAGLLSRICMEYYQTNEENPLRLTFLVDPNDPKIIASTIAPRPPPTTAELRETQRLDSRESMQAKHLPIK